MSVKIYAIIFGLLFISIGVLGFFPELVFRNLLFGVFTINIVQNIFHLLIGVLALIAAFSAYLSRLYFKIFAIVFLFLAVLGLMVEGNFVFMKSSLLDSLFHLIIAAIFIYLGFGKPRHRPDVGDSAKV